MKDDDFGFLQGIQCFDYDRALNLLVTGSRDFLVRFWNSYVPKQPQAILKGHEVTVIDIKILSEKDMVISYSGDMVQSQR